MFRVLPPSGGDPRAVAEVVNGAMNGKTNNTGEFSLAAGTSTVVTDSRCGVGSIVLVMPQTLAAANLSVWLAATSRGQFTVGHSTASGGEKFSYVVVG